MSEIKKKQGLIDFEDLIKLESFSLSQALELKRGTSKEIYVIGEGINEYNQTLTKLGFKNLWQELERSDNPSVRSVFIGMKDQPNPRGGNALLMYSYVDYVLNHTSADLMIFLPKKSRILFDDGLAGPTYDEIMRTLEHFNTKWERIHFVTGLFDISSTDFEEQNA